MTHFRPNRFAAPTLRGAQDPYGRYASALNVAVAMSRVPGERRNTKTADILHRKDNHMEQKQEIVLISVEFFMRFKLFKL